MPSPFWPATLTIALTLLAAAPPPAVAEDPARAQLEARLDRLRADVAAAEEKAATLGDDLVDLAGDDAKLRAELDTVAARVSGLETEIVAEEETLAAITRRQSVLREDLTDRRAAIGATLAALQRMGRRPPPALFADGRPQDVVRGALALNAVLPGLSDSAAALSEDLREVSRLAEEERDKWTQIRNALADVVGERARLEALRSELERRRALSVYERDQAAATLARLNDEAATVEDLLAGVDRGEGTASGAGSDFAARRGSLPYPVAGRVVATFGEAVAGGALSEGIVLSALPGSTAFSPMPAVVLYAAPFRTFGPVLILDAGGGYHMVLAGLEEVYANVGDQVETGAPLGRMGERMPAGAARLWSAGDASSAAGDAGSGRPTLYVELRQHGTAIDSHDWWQDAGRQVRRMGE